MKHRNRRDGDSFCARKDLQYCRQVQRVLNLALSELSVIADIGGLFVDDVAPAPDCGHLMVGVVVPEGCGVSAALATLRRESPRLRSEVAMTIARKRAPELCFVPVAGEGGGDE